MNHNFLIFIFIFSISHSYCTRVDPCDNVPEPLFVDVANCQTPPCELPLGQNAVMNITFRVPKFSEKISPSVRATVGGITVPYPLPSDGCNHILNGYCPVVPEEILIYHFELPIKGFPEVAVGLRFTLNGDKKSPLICFKINCQVVKPQE